MGLSASSSVIVASPISLSADGTIQSETDAENSDIPTGELFPRGLTVE